MSFLPVPGAPRKLPGRPVRQNNARPRRLPVEGATPGAPVKEKGTAPRTRTKPPRKLTFRPFAFARQRSLEDEDGNSVLGTHQHTTQPHASLNKKKFFSDDFIALLRHDEQISTETLAEHLQSCIEDDSPALIVAKELVEYLHDKKQTLLRSSPGKKVILGATLVQVGDMYVIDALERALGQFIRRAETIRRAALASAQRNGSSSSPKLSF